MVIDTTLFIATTTAATGVSITVTTSKQKSLIFHRTKKSMAIFSERLLRPSAVEQSTPGDRKHRYPAAPVSIDEVLRYFFDAFISNKTIKNMPKHCSYLLVRPHALLRSSHLLIDRHLRWWRLSDQERALLQLSPHLVLCPL